LGLDPWGECPNNPESGERLAGTADYEIVVTRQIRAGKVAAANLQRVSKPKERLAAELDATQAQLAWYRNFVHELRQRLEGEPGTSGKP
jgi:hypothetical protein